MKYTEEIDAKVTMTVRYVPDGGAVTAKASATCEYQPGSTASAEVDLPEAAVRSIRSVLADALPAVEEALGKNLAHSRHEATRIATAMGEMPPKDKPASRRVKPTKGRR